MEIQARIKEHCSQHMLLYFVIGATFFFGLCAHAYRFFNLDFSHDSMLIFEGPDALWQISLGRFAQPLYWEIRGDLTAPFLLCSLSLIWLALANYIVVSLLELRSLRHIALLCGILSTNTVMTLSFATYLPWIDVYTLAYLLAALAAWLAVRYPFGFAAAWVPITLSLALYQSYFNVTVFLLMIVFVKHVLDGFETKQLLRRIAKYFGALLGGPILYYIVLQLVLFATSSVLTDSYNGISAVGDFGDISIPFLIAATYGYPILYMFFPETYHPWVTVLAEVFVLTAAIVALVRTVRVKKLAKPPRLLLTLCVLAMPFGMDVVLFISKGVHHSLTIFSFFLFYPFAFMLWEYHSGLPAADLPQRGAEAAKRIRALFPAVSGCLLLTVIVFNIVFANQVYLKKSLEYQATISFMTKLTYSIEQTEGYEPGVTPVLVVGEFEASSLFAEREGFEQISGTGLAWQFAVIFSDSFPQFFNSVLSYRINWMNMDYAYVYAELPEVQAMPVYPAKGSCRIVDGVLFVKLS